MENKEQKKLHMIGNAHLDLVWLWRWQEGFQEGKSTFRSALDRMAEFDDFTFTASTAALYEWVEQNAPDLFEEIRGRVAEGRWEIAGGWWVQPDCNIPSGESFVRQGLLGQRYFYEKFGVIARTAYNVDSFGHSGMLPQIFQKSGLSAYVMMRPMSHEKGLPSPLFLWESDDGTRIPAFRILYEYLSWGKALDYHISRCAAELNQATPHIMCFYGVGNHGGGPTVENITSIRRARETNSGPGAYEILFSTPNRYFAAAAPQSERLPVVHGELLHHAAGCYAAHSGIKRMNRLCENRLLMAEKLSVMAGIRGDHLYPENFGGAWKKVLLNQFHDTLAGTGIATAYEDAASCAGYALCVADENLNHAAQAMSWRINIPKEDNAQPLVVFNPVCGEIKTFIDFETAAGPGDVFTIRDSSGKEIPCQKLRSRVVVNGRSRVGFAADLPSLGYETFRLYKAVGDGQAETALTASETCLENANLRLEINPETGCIESLCDKKKGFEIFRGEAAVPVVIEDESDTWSHDVTRFDKAAGTFRCRSVRLAEQGPVCASIEVISDYGASRIVQTFTLYAELDLIDVAVKVIWNDRRKMLRLAFPMRTGFNQYCWESAFGYTERGNTGEEYPLHSWMDATGVTADQGDIYGLSILNDGKTSASVDKNTLNLTILRSPVYAHHAPAALDENAEYDVIDEGVQRFRYALFPHDGKRESSDMLAYAESMNQPPFLIPETFHQGPLPQRDSFLSLSPGNIRVSAVKRAEDGAGTVVRLWESHKTGGAAVLKLPHMDVELSLSFGRNEIKTLYIPDGGGSPREVNLIEFTAAEMAAITGEKQE